MSLVTDTMGQSIYDKQKVKMISVKEPVLTDQTITLTDLSKT